MSKELRHPQYCQAEWPVSFLMWLFPDESETLVRKRVDRIPKEQVKACIREILLSVTERERIILIRHFRLKESYRVISKEVGIAPSRISKILQDVHQYKIDTAWVNSMLSPNRKQNTGLSMELDMLAKEPIMKLKLSPRANNALARSGIMTIQQAVDFLTKHEPAIVMNLGGTGEAELVSALYHKGVAACYAAHGIHIPTPALPG